MRTAIVSDIHGNLAALEAVIADIEREQPELVVQGGDVALQGAHPAEVVDLVRELGWPGVVGNTDELLWRAEDLPRQEARAPKLRRLLRLLYRSHGPWTSERLGAGRIEWLRGLPLEWRRDGLLVLHASPGNLWRAPMPDTDDAVLEETYGGLDAELVVYGHIHRPYVRELPDLTVANSGSVGLPADGDRRASYLLLEDDVPSVRRVEYDVEREAAELARRAHPDAAWLAERYRQAKFLRPPGQ
jgi:predicted phosphodiesterase